MDMSVPTLQVPRPARGTATPSQIFTALWRGRWLTLVCGLVLAALCFAGASQLPPRYTGSGALVIETQHLIPELQGALSSDGGIDGNGDGQLTLHTEMQVLQSRPMLLAVADGLGFARDPLRNPLLRPPGILQRLAVAAATFVPGGRARTMSPRDPARMQDAVLREMKDNLSIGNDQNSRIIRVDYTDPDPKVAAEVVNTLMQRYIASRTNARTRVDREANATLQQRVGEVRAEIASLEQQMQAVRAQNSFVMVRAGSVSQQRLEELTSALTHAEDDRMQIEARWQRALALAKTGGVPVDQSDVLDSKTISSLRAREAEAEQILADITQRFGPNHPTYYRAMAALAAARAAITAEAQRITTALGSQLQAARAREAELARQLQVERNKAGVAATVQAKLADLEKDATAQRQVLETLLARVEQTSAEPRGAPQMPGARIVVSAAPPVLPSTPRPKLAGGIGLVAGLAFGGLLSVVRGGGAGGRIMSLSESADETGLPVLCMVPRLRNGRQAALPASVVGTPLAAATEAVRVLRTRLRFSGRAAPRSVVFVSSVVGEGASSIAAAFARVAAMDGVRTLLVEGDLQSPSLGHLLGCSAGATGLAQVLEGTVAWRDAVTRDTTTPLDLLLAYRPRSNAQQLLESMRFQNLLAEAAEDYNLIVMDAPPVTSDSGALLLIHRADAAVLVVGAGVVRRGSLLAGMDRLAGTSRKSLACVLNRAG